VDGPAVITVSRFVEKPNAPLARILIDAGALWNTFIVAALAQALLRVFAQRFPQTVAEMRSVIEPDQCTGAPPDTAIDLYRRLPGIDFSRQILQNSESTLRVFRVDDCGWSDHRNGSRRHCGDCQDSRISRTMACMFDPDS